MYLYPLIIRIWHWINAMLIILLIVSGLCMQYAGSDWAIMRFDISVRMHDISGILLSVSYIMFIIGNIVTGNGKHYICKFRGFGKKMWNQIRYYSFGIFKGQDPPYPIYEENKFNPLQKVSYIVIMFIGVPLVILTGWLLMFPGTLVLDVLGLNGLHITDVIHVVVGFIISIFLFIHIYFCTIGATPGSNFRSMFTGWHTKH